MLVFIIYGGLRNITVTSILGLILIALSTCSVNEDYLTKFVPIYGTIVIRHLHISVNFFRVEKVVFYLLPDIDFIVF